MAALDRPTNATYTIHESVTVDTTDREDHTFCGIMFPIKAKRSLPIHQVVINSISVRGRLGPLTIWVTKDEEAYRDEEKKRLAIEEASAAAAAAASAAASAASAASLEETAASSSSTSESSPSPKKSRYSLRARLSRSGGSSKKSTQSSSSQSRAVQPIRGEISMKKKHWTKIYEREHAPSFRDYTELDLSASPIILTPGQVRGIYIHSTLPGDEAIVYDNKHKVLTHDDGFITILPGRAHVSETPFGRMPIWGWGNAWRDNREFVGRVSYGAVYRLWNPSEHMNFGSNFQTLALTLFKCQRRWESPLSMLGDEVIFYILNMCKWDWVDDDVDEIAEKQKKMRKLRRRREALLAATEAASAGSAKPASAEGGCGDYASVLTDGAVEDGDRKMPANDCKMSSEDCKMPAIVSPEIGSTVASAQPSQELRIDSSDDEEDDDEEYEENESDDSDEDDDEDDEFDDYRGMNPSVFHYRDYEEEDSDEEAANEERRLADAESRRRSWLRSQFARIHVLNALASMNDGGGGDEGGAEAMDVDSDDAAVGGGGGAGGYIRYGDGEDDSDDEDYVDG
mmetsp:Transcript_1781/g.3927  ORF Transcript_1781/g.3927 Transcript_1781/m.3927 type:complete len:569 (+) Transcript_1781:299-2005(+)